MKKYSYISFAFDFSVYYKPDHKPEKKIIIAFYDDNVLITSLSQTEIVCAKSMLKSNFWMVELGPYTYYLGMTVNRDWQQKQIQLSQPAYQERVLREHGMGECKPIIVPMDTQLSVAETR